MVFKLKKFIHSLLEVSTYKIDKNGSSWVEGVEGGVGRQTGTPCHLFGLPLLPPTPEPSGRHLGLRSSIIPPVKYLEYFFQPLLLLKLFSLVMLPKDRYGNDLIFIISSLLNQNFIVLL